MSTCRFVEACNDYRWLLERGYSERAALTIVADHHRLDREQRACLFRGVVPPFDARARRAKLVAPADARGRPLAVDWYNCLITVESWLRGTTVFEAEDGVLRDAAGVHGSYRVSAVTPRALDAITAALSSIAPSRVEAFVDAPLAFSAEMAVSLRDAWQGLPWPSAVSVERSADARLKAFDGLVASADSAVLDAAAAVLDLARHALALAWDVSPPAVGSLFP